MKTLKNVLLMLLAIAKVSASVVAVVLITWLYFQPDRGDLDLFLKYRDPVIYVWDAATPLDYATFDETDRMFCWNNMLFVETGFMGLNIPSRDDTGTVRWCEYANRFSDIYEETESSL